jgi:hypothetical protein
MKLSSVVKCYWLGMTAASVALVLAMILAILLTSCRCRECQHMQDMERRAVRHGQWYEGKR